jgi:hypothetical protein
MDRPIFRFHLITFILLVLLAGVILGLNMQVYKVEPVDLYEGAGGWGTPQYFVVCYGRGWPFAAWTWTKHLAYPYTAFDGNKLVGNLATAVALLVACAGFSEWAVRRGSITKASGRKDPDLIMGADEEKGA